MTQPEREEVSARAQARCEYCRYPELESLLPHQLDHVIAKQHGGADDLSNLAFSCVLCNRYKGPNLSSVDPQTRSVVRLFNPRTQAWTEHFALVEAKIEGLTPEGRATAFLLRFNEKVRIAERLTLMQKGRWKVS